ncbi:zinc finger BED domain-containing protein 6-like [Microplitis demolitor]|uniref:zinc finger BED domain-containing protein 6-like n=1 Tax=Microplitis demolitor TaxID=69319 RepID=UPI0004CD8EB8|nr:zinc finger BED domain-containing protein 6-like [Microplitis demolitor]
MSEEVHIEVEVNPSTMMVDDSDTDPDDGEEVNNTDEIVTENENCSVRSAAWMHFKLDKSNSKKAICNLCSQILSLPTGTTSPMFKHLRAKHKDEYKKCIEEKNRKRKSADDDEEEKTKKRKQSLLSVPEKQEIDQLIMEMIAIDLKPFSWVEDRGFRNLLRKLSPDYEPPCRTTFFRSLAPILYHKTKQKSIAELSREIESGLMSLSFTTDCWKSKANDSYISLTLNYLTSDFFPKNLMLNIKQLLDRLTGNNLKSHLFDMMSEWDLSNIDNVPIFFITDNARNISSAISQLEVTHFYCFAHTLQLVLKDAESKSSGVKELLSKFRKFAGHFHHSDPGRRKFEEAQSAINNSKPLQLIQMVTTRWNSDYEMLERMQRVQKPLSTVLAESRDSESI